MSVMSDETSTAAAIDWHLRQPSMTADDWALFIAWLESDPAHSAAYDSVALVDNDLASLPPVKTKVPLSPVVPRRTVRLPSRRWVGTAIAASLVALVGTMLWAPRGDTQVIATVAGAPRVLTIGDGTRIAINGATRLTLDRSDPRHVALETGEALFEVRHDPDHPFSVSTGRFVIQDVGTVFNVARSGSRLAIAVAEGSVVFDPGHQAIVLTPGRALVLDEASGTVTLGRSNDIGGWRRNELVFSGEPLATVADAVMRRSGSRIRLEGGLSTLPFTGNIHLSGDAARDARHLALLTGTRAHDDGGIWVLSPTS